MKLKGFIYKYLGYSRSERTGAIVLVIIVFSLLTASLLRTGRDYDSNSEYIEIDDNCLADSTTETNIVMAEYFLFDPNTLSRDSLILLGISSKTASTLINYRNSGARFRMPSDLKKVYGMTLALYDSLLPYISIAPLVTERTGKYDIENDKDAAIQSPGAVFTNTVGQDIDSIGGYKILLDINSADSTDLERLPGIGRVLGARIVKYRNLLGGYISLKQLEEVYGVDSMLVSQVRNFVYIDTTLISRLNLNYDEYSLVLRHPYIDKKLCNDIFYYRRLSGKIDSLGELVKNRITDPETISRISPYISLSDTSSR